jgi:hypothetical protein
MANFGNYGSQLRIDDYNRALQAGGSSYQLPQQQAQNNSFAGNGANPYDAMPVQSAPVQQATDTEVPYMRRASANEGKEKERGGSFLSSDTGAGKALGIIGKIAAFL